MPRVNLTYTLYKGASFVLESNSDAAATLAKIATLGSVQSVWPVKSWQAFPDPATSPKVPAPGGHANNGTRISPTHRRQSANDTYSPHVMTQVDRLRAKGITGKGIRVAVIDTGIDYKHPALGGCFGPGCLVAYGTDLVGDGDSPVPDADPIDCNGHGTHVAGIIAAQNNPLGFTGAAPGVTLGAYKAATCAGKLDTDIIIAAFNQAFDDGSHIINLSSVAGSGWNEDPVAVAVQRIVERGVPCITAMGNTGFLAFWSLRSPGACVVEHSSCPKAKNEGKKKKKKKKKKLTFPAAGLGVTGVANIVNTETPVLHAAASYSVNGTSTSTPFSWHPGLPAFPETISLPLFPTSNTTNATNDGCTSFPAGTDLSGVLPLVRVPPNGDPNACGIADKIKVLLAAKAKYVMFYSLAAATAVIDGTLPEPGILGTGEVTAAQAETWVNLVNSGRKVVVNLVGISSADTVIYSLPNTQSGGLVAQGSSWGLSQELHVKPQLAAPGQNIVSTWLLSAGGYKVDSGTSMSSPLVAAAYALVAEARGTHDPSILISLLSSTAKPVVWYDGKRKGDALAPVAQQGAGIIQLYDAAFTSTFINVSSFALNDTDHFVSRHVFTITNNSTQAATYQLGHVPAATVYFSSGSFLNDPDEFSPSRFPPALVTGTSASATLTFSSSTLSLAAGASASITVTFAPPSGLDPGRLPWYSGYLTIDYSTNSSSPLLRIPYAGVLGSLHSAPGLYLANSTNFPGNTFLGTWSLEPIEEVPANTTFTVPRPSGPPNQGEPPRNISYPTSVVTRKLATTYARLDVVPVEVNGPLNTSVVLGVEIAGSMQGYPKRFVASGGDADAFTGMLSDGRVVPEGRYRFLARTLKVFGDEANVGDYNVAYLPEFTLRYADSGKP